MLIFQQVKIYFELESIPQRTPKDPLCFFTLHLAHFCCLAKDAFFGEDMFGPSNQQIPAIQFRTLQPCLVAIFRQIKFCLWQIVTAWPSSSMLLWHLVWKFWDLLRLFQWYVRLPCNATAEVEKIWTRDPRLRDLEAFELEGRCFPPRLQGCSGKELVGPRFFLRCYVFNILN